MHLSIIFQKKKVHIQEEPSLNIVNEQPQRILSTVQEDEVLTSGTFSRSGSLRKKKKANTPRPMWRY